MLGNTTEIIQRLLTEEHPEIKLADEPLSMDHIELMLMAIKSRGEVKIYGARSVPNLLELGAWIANLGKYR